MANAQGMCLSFKQELLTGTHVIGTDVLKIALYNANAAGMQPATTTAYATTISSATEVANSGTYTAGGSTVTFLAPTNNSTTTAFTGPTGGSTVSWTGFSATNFDAALIYNSSKTNKAVSIHTFSAQTITSGTFTITFPANAAGTAMINLA